LKEDHILLKNENERNLLELNEKLKLIEDLKNLNKKIPEIVNTENSELDKNLKNENENSKNENENGNGNENENEKIKAEESENLKLMIEDLNGQLQALKDQVYIFCIYMYVYIYLCIYIYPHVYMYIFFEVCVYLCI
jgi:hypothetical protein